MALLFGIASAGGANVAAAPRATPSIKKKAPAGPPNLAAIGAQYSDAIVRVEIEDASGRRRTRTGFFVSGRGHVLTAGGGIDLDTKVTIELRRGDRLAAHVVATHSDGIAALQLDAPMTAATARWTFLRVDAGVVKRRPRGWFVSLGHAPKGGHVVAAAGEIASGSAREWLADIPGSVGAPILTKSGQVVGLVDKRLNAAQTRVRPATVVQSLLKNLADEAPR